MKSGKLGAKTIFSRHGWRSQRPRTLRRRGFTLAELSISVISTSILLSGIASSIFIASKAVYTESATMTGSLIATEIADELATANSIQERGSRAITIQFADRDSNGSPETVRYSWSGVAGASLMRTYNGSSTAVAKNVHLFQLAYSSQSTERKRTILLVRGSPTGSRGTYDGRRKDLLEGWGFQPIPYLITATTPLSEINTMLSKADAVYLSSTVSAADIGTKFLASTKGVVIEVPALCNEFKLTNAEGSSSSLNSIKIIDNDHYITSTFSTGSRTIASSNQSLISFGTSIGKAPGATFLCKPPSGPDELFPVMDSGGQLVDGSSSAGRRILLPWGIQDFNPSVLDTDGRELLKRSLNWAAYGEANTAVDITLQIGSSSSGRIQTRVELAGRPPL